MYIKQVMAAKFLTNDYVNLTTKTGEYQGTIMPSSDESVILLKLNNGYNIGVKIDTVTKSKKLKTSAPIKFPSIKLEKNPKLPNISLITTGGTITSKVDYKTGGVYALSKPEELLAQIPEISKVTNLKIINPFNVMSEDMEPRHWQKLATLVEKELNKKEVSGVIITHGTDTLHWTSAALSLMLGKINKPVALVGGQRSSDRGSFDGAQNLICAAYYCLSNIAEVAIVMHESTEDKSCIAMRSVKVRKMHTSRRDAFRPINELPLARISSDGKIEVLNNNFRRRSDIKIDVDTRFDSKVALIQFVSGTRGELIDYYVSKGYKGIIIQGEGLGHVTVNGSNDWLPPIQKAIKKKVFIGMTSQCIYGRVNPFVYTNLRRVSDEGVIYLEDMLPEVAYIKLGCLLGRKLSLNKLKEEMLKNCVGEINLKIDERSFLY